MNAGWLAASLVLVVSAASARDRAGDEAEIRRVEARLCEAFEKGDAKTLRTFLDARFTLVNSHGELTDLRQNLDEVEKREPYYDEFRNHDQTVRLYGDAAIINGVTSIKGKSGGQPFAADFEFTDTYVYRDGHWLLAASHASRLAK
jgi:ketosteroid isomerase-like protein